MEIGRGKGDHLLEGGPFCRTLIITIELVVIMFCWQLSSCSEVALSQIEAEVGEAGLTVAGLYHAHDNMADNHVDVFNQKVVLPFLCQ